MWFFKCCSDLAEVSMTPQTIIVLNPRDTKRFQIFQEKNTTFSKLLFVRNLTISELPFLWTLWKRRGANNPEDPSNKWSDILDMGSTFIKKHETVFWVWRTLKLGHFGILNFNLWNFETLKPTFLLFPIKGILSTPQHSDSHPCTSPPLGDTSD